MSNFKEFDLLYKSGVLRDFQLWRPVSSMPLEVQGLVVPFMKPPINISLETNHQECLFKFKPLPDPAKNLNFT